MVIASMAATVVVDGRAASVDLGCESALAVKGRWAARTGE
jgi:hypothetical protein